MRVKLFFGWYIVTAAFLLGMYHGGIIAFGFTAFIAPIVATFGWSYAQVSFGTSLRGLEVGALDPFVGTAADRWPARRLVLIGVSLYGLGLVGISQAGNLAVFYLGFLVLGLGNSLTVGVVLRTTIAKWFKRDLGKASAVISMGAPIGGVLVPLLVRMIDIFTWQTSLLILAAGVWVIGVPLSFVFRASPEENGLLFDGKPRNDAEGQRRPQSPDLGVGVKEVLKMRAFWHIGIATMLQIGSIQAVITQVMPYLSSLGVERSTASMITMFIPLVSLTARIPFGWLADIFPNKYLIATSACLTSAGLFLFWLIDGNSFVLIYAFVAVFGLGLAGMSIRTPLVREYFGTKNFGTIYGLIAVFGMIGLLVYPPVAGWVYDSFGTYKPIWLVFGGGSIIGVILALTTPSSRSQGQSHRKLH